MRYRDGFGHAGGGGIFGSVLGRIPEGVKWILLANFAVFIVQHVLLRTYGTTIVEWFGLSSRDVLHGRVWQLVTYLFVHGGIGHFFFNMLYVLMFGGIVERAWGRATFLRYYMITGVGAGIVWALLRFGNDVPTVGASGAVYAVMVAFAVLYPEATVLLFFVLPVKAKYLIAGLIGISVYYQLTSANDGVAHLVHLAGAAIGFVLLKRGGTTLKIPSPFAWYRRWRMRRKLSVIDYRELMKFDDDQDSGAGRGGRPR